MPRSPLPHQKRAIAAFWALYEQGKRKICVQAPCGAGKSMLSTMIIKDAIERLLGKSRNKKVHIAFLGHRRLLVSQTSRVFDEEQIEHGIQAAGMDRDEGLPIQICSRDTLTSRHLRRKHKAPIPLIDLLIIDERHVNKSSEIVELEKQMRDKNPDLCTLSLTATPVDIWNVCDDLIIAGTNSELRATVPPLHLPCKVFAPDMLDIRMLKRNKVSGEFEEAKSPWANAQYAPTIFGRVYPHWKALNPDQRPAILFAPSVASSMYFVDLFLAKGVPAAHIDGECIYTGEKNEDGSNKVNFTTDIEEREKVFSGLKSGQYKVLCNRLVLADAIDLPWAYHLILATSFGSIATYLQAVGRIQRAHPSLPGHVCVQDHGSNALRFGHPDIDREWKVGDKWSDFVREIGEESDRIKDKSKPENEQKEILCECGQFRVGGPVCPSCGRQSGRGKVMVLQLDGKLKPFKPKPPKKVNTDPPAIKEWKSLVYRVKNAHSARGMTFEMALNAFKREHRGCIVHPNKDKNGVERWCVLHDGKVCPIPLLPPIADSHMMSLRVGQVSPDDFKKLYRLSTE